MKRLLYILLCLPLWLACTDENIPNPNPQISEGEQVELRMSMMIEDMNIASSRSMGDDVADFPTLWVVAFDKEGYLVEYAPATDLKLTGNGSTLHETEFSVILHATSEPRTLHFIANYTDGEEKLALEYGHESNVIGSLTVGNNKDVYWHRKVLSEGINTDQTYITANFRRIPLLRNFAKITVGVDQKVTNFILTGFYVLNVPTSGTVAPYSNGAFVDYMSNEEGKTEEAKTYEKLNEENYIGTMPDDVGYGQNGSSIDWVTVTEEETGSFYMYENTYKGVENKTTSILIKGIFGNSSTETYYRADLTLPNVATGLSEYYHILRNFHYQLNITSVIAAGKDTPEAAIEAPANNNLSGSVQVQNLSNISDGTAKLEVSYTDMVMVSTDKVTLKYRFLTNLSNENSVANDRITIYNPGGEVIDEILDTEQDEDGWRVLTITPIGSLPTSTKEQTITLYDITTKLRREVKYTLRPKLDMVVNCTPYVEEGAGKSVEVDICIPDRLNENLFPLEFAIEANTSVPSSTLKQYLSPAKTEVMSVKTGGSIVPGFIGQKSYQYIKELTYEDYLKLSIEDSKRVLKVDFVTNIAVSASMVYVENKYFNKGNDFFVNVNPAIVDMGYYGAGKDLSVVFTAKSTAVHTITATNATPATQTVSLSQGDTYEAILKTSTWNAPTTVNITGFNALTSTAVRNKLAMKAASTSGTGLTSATELYVYASETDAKKMAETNLYKVTNGTLTSTYDAVIVRDNLTENTLLYFAYETAEYIYVASATAKALAEGTAVLTFVGYEKPLKWSAELTGEQYYGTGKTVTLTLTTNKPGTYNVTFKEGNNNGGTATITVSEGSTTGSATYSTQSWSGAISAVVTSAKNEKLDVSGDSRNVLKITASIADNNSNAENYITNSSNSDTDITISNNNDYGGTTYGTIKAEALMNGTAEITYNGLTANQTIYFRFYYYYNRKWQIGSANSTPQDATGTGNITFN